MTVNEIAEKLNGSILCQGEEGLNLSCGYAGDFLSRVISNAPFDCVWLTIMNNVNVAGVAVMADIKAIVLCEGVVADELLLAKCRAENIALIATNLNVYESCRLL